MKRFQGSPGIIYQSEGNSLKCVVYPLPHSRDRFNVTLINDSAH